MPWRTRARIRFGIIRISAQRLIERHRVLFVLTPVSVVASMFILMMQTSVPTEATPTFIPIASESVVEDVSNPVVADAATPQVGATHPTVSTNDTVTVSDVATVPRSYVRHKKFLAQLTTQDLRRKATRTEMKQIRISGDQRTVSNNVQVQQLALAY